MTGEERRQRLEALRTANRQRIRRQGWERNTLLQECLALLSGCRILDPAEEAAAVREVNRRIGTARRGTPLPELAPAGRYLVVWDEAGLPVVECTGAELLRHWEDVAAVAFSMALWRPASEELWLSP